MFQKIEQRRREMNEEAERAQRQRVTAEEAAQAAEKLRKQQELAAALNTPEQKSLVTIAYSNNVTLLLHEIFNYYVVKNESVGNPVSRLAKRANRPTFNPMYNTTTVGEVSVTIAFKRSESMSCLNDNPYPSSTDGKFTIIIAQNNGQYQVGVRYYTELEGGDSQGARSTTQWFNSTTELSDWFIDFEAQNPLKLSADSF